MRTVSEKFDSMRVPSPTSFFVVSKRLLGPYESSLERMLLDRLSASSARVTDESGGCGSSYHVKVVSKTFDNLSKLKQHRMVQDVLKDDIKKWHAIRIDTSVD